MDNLINDKLDSPFNKFPVEGPIPIISKGFIKSALSSKFYTINENDLNTNYEKFRVISNPSKSSN